MHRAWISACLKMDFRIWLVLRCVGEAYVPNREKGAGNQFGKQEPGFEGD